MTIKFTKSYGPFRKGAVIEAEENRPGQVYIDDAKEGITYKVVLFIDKLIEKGVVKKK